MTRRQKVRKFIDENFTYKDLEFIGMQLELIKYVEANIPKKDCPHVLKYMKSKAFAKYLNKYQGNKAAALRYIKQKLKIK